MMFEEYLKKEERRKERNGKERSEGGREGGREAGCYTHRITTISTRQVLPGGSFDKDPSVNWRRSGYTGLWLSAWILLLKSLWLLILKVVGRPCTWAGGASGCSQVRHGQAEKIKVSDRVFSAPFAPQLEHSDFPASTSSVASDLYKRQIRPCDSSS